MRHLLAIAAATLLSITTAQADVTYEFRPTSLTPNVPNAVPYGRLVISDEAWANGIHLHYGRTSVTPEWTALGLLEFSFGFNLVGYNGPYADINGAVNYTLADLLPYAYVDYPDPRRWWSWHIDIDSDPHRTPTATILVNNGFSEGEFHLSTGQSTVYYRSDAHNICGTDHCPVSGVWTRVPEAGSLSLVLTAMGLLGIAATISRRQYATEFPSP